MKVDSLIILLLVLFSLSGCNEQNKSTVEAKETTSPAENSWQISSSVKWLENQGLINVESIIYDESNQVFYATSGLSYSLGTSGFISKISKTGVLEELKWISDLNRPTGMAIRDSLLYVADVNTLVVINTRNGAIIDKHMESVPNSGLNDVAISEKGEVYVSASFIHSIFKLNEGKLNLFIKDEEALKWANGLTIVDNKLYVAGLTLSTIDLEAIKLSSIQLNPEAKDFDGIVSDGEHGFFVTTVENSSLFHINKEKEVAKLLTEDIYFGDIDFNPQSRNIYVPRGNRKTNEFYISVFNLNKIGNK